MSKQMIKDFSQLIANQNNFYDSVNGNKKDRKNSKEKYRRITERKLLFATGQTPPTDEEISARQELVVNHANATRPILDANVVPLMEEYIAYIKVYGTNIEKAVYENMTPTKLVTRLLHKRPLTFFNRTDAHILRDGTDGHSGETLFKNIGTEDEKAPYVMRDYISYSEMQISALLGVSSPTHFINVGDRGNCGKQGNAEDIENTGIYVGQVGARFESPEQMEWQHLLVTKEQNTEENGYGANADPKNPKTQLLRLWAKNIYGLEYFPSYEEAIKDSTNHYSRNTNQREGTLFNKAAFLTRMISVYRPLLIEANERVKQSSHHSKAYVHLVGLGTGAWGISDEQAPLIVDAVASIISENTLEHISDIDFSWFGNMCTQCGNTKDGEVFSSDSGNSIKIHFSLRNPADKLKGENEGKLLVAQYAWDANSFPGNEVFFNMLRSSGDPAAAMCSHISWFQNPIINPNVCGENAKTYSTQKTQTFESDEEINENPDNTSKPSLSRAEQLTALINELETNLTSLDIKQTKALDAMEYFINDLKNIDGNSLTAKRDVTTACLKAKKSTLASNSKTRYYFFMALQTLSVIFAIAGLVNKYHYKTQYSLFYPKPQPKAREVVEAFNEKVCSTI